MAKLTAIVDNAVETKLQKYGFQEGTVRVDKSEFQVIPGFKDDPAVVALVWNVTRLNDDLQPLTGEDGEELTETLTFGFGKTSLEHIQPASAAGPDDFNVTPLGTEVETAGPTLDAVTAWFPNKKSGVTKLQNSLIQKGFRKDIVDRLWAPDYNGAVFFMKPEDDLEMERKFTKKDGTEGKSYVAYKVVDRILVRPYEKGAQAAAKSAPKSAPAATPASGETAEELATSVINTIALEFAGKSLSRKALRQRVQGVFTSQKLDPKQLVPVTGLLKSDWLEKNAEMLEIVLTDGGDTVEFAA